MAAWLPPPVPAHRAIAKPTSGDDSGGCRPCSAFTVAGSHGRGRGGDLGQRRLTGDGLLQPDTPFQPFRRRAGLPLLRRPARNQPDRGPNRGQIGPLRGKCRLP
jgi:hypothetical protein